MLASLVTHDHQYTIMGAGAAAYAYGLTAATGAIGAM